MDRTTLPEHAQDAETDASSANRPSPLPDLEEEARRHFEEGNLNQAITAMQQLLSLAPENTPARFNLGVLFHSAGELGKAIDCYQDVCAVEPEHFQVHANLGNALNELGRQEDAITAFEKALHIEPAHVGTLQDLGSVYLNKDRPQEAMSCFQRVLSHDPTYCPAHYNLGLAYFHQDNLEEAVSCYLKAAECAPDDGDICYNLGLTYQALAQNDEAIFWYQKAAEINPNDQDVYFNLGSIFKDLNDLDEAVRSFEKYIALAPTSGAGLSNLGMLYHMQDRTDMAIACYQRALKSGYEIETAKHMLAALTGENNEFASTRYVADLFDNYAERFDDSLIDDLEYRVPDLLRQLVENTIPSKSLSFRNVLDLGAGTGLAGLAFQTMAHRLTGVDLSTKMIVKAREKKIYTHLHVAEAINFIKETDKKYDLLIAADVFTYIGNLNPFFSAVGRCLLPGGMLVFSTENHTGADYFLKPSGRYGHSTSYIRNLAAENGWNILKQQEAELRKDKGQWICGTLYLLQLQPKKQEPLQRQQLPY